MPIILIVINLLFHISSAIIVINRVRKKGKPKFLGICTYFTNFIMSIVHTYVFYSLAYRYESVNYIPLLVLWLIGNCILEYALYVSLTSMEWQEEIYITLKYLLLGNLLLLCCAVILRVGSIRCL